jgi:uncharacterized protein (UPF0548 family)
MPIQALTRARHSEQPGLAVAGLTVTPETAPIEEGGTVVVSRNFGPVLLVAPCRIVYTTATATRFGFAYGTLPGHPE